MSLARVHISRWCDRIALTGLAVGVVLMVQPGWKIGFQVGFFVTLVGILAQIITGHVVAAAVVSHDEAAASSAQARGEKHSTP